MLSVLSELIFRIIYILRTNQAKDQHRGTIRLLQITDSHLFADKSKSLLGVNTFDSFHAVLSQIAKQNTEFDYAVITGDISQDQTSESYQSFLEGIADWQQPSYCLAGNHDYQPNMQKVLGSSLLTYKEHVLLNQNWQMIVLDSQVEGKPHGFLAKEQFDLLENILSQSPDKHTLLLFHHHPLYSGSAWLDQHRLHNQDELWEKLKDYPQVKAIVCGHIHQDLDLEHQGCRVLAAPSTCIQFLPNSDDFALDSKAPGWREIALHPDGTISTIIGRISEELFDPDMKSSGY